MYCGVCLGGGCCVCNDMLVLGWGIKEILWVGVGVSVCVWVCGCVGVCRCMCVCVRRGGGMSQNLIERSNKLYKDGTPRDSISRSSSC